MANKPILSTQADLASSQTAGAPALVMPTGVVLPFAGTAAPTGWLACDGTAISRTTYASLFAAISTSYGVGDGSTTFNLPDLRGRFPRFNDAMFGGSAAGRDSGRVLGSAQGQATAKNGLTASASPSGISGTAATAGNHGHGGVYASITLSGTNTGNVNSVSAGNGGGGVTSFSGGLSPGGDHSHSISGTANAQTITVGAGDSETRPINLSINAIIKV